MYQFEEIAKEIDIVHFCGITLAMNDTVRHHMKSLARAVKENGGTVVFDCNYRPSLWEKTDMNRQNRIMKKCWDLLISL